MKEELENETTEGKIFYHISSCAYVQGDVVSIDTFNGVTHYHQNLSREDKEIDNYLSENRSTYAPSRSHCIYAFVKMEYCVYFRNKELRNGETFHLYKCKMDVSKGHPMILVGKIKSASEQDREKLKEEYWNPTRKWMLLEYLSDTIEILEEIPITPELITRSTMIGQCDYSEDYDRANHI